MNWRQYNWLLGCMAVVVTMVILFGGQLLWEKFAVAKPLDKAFLNINGVVDAAWEDQSKKGEPIKIYVTLQNIDNLAQTYEELSDGAKKVLGKKPFKLLIRDSRSPELEQFHYKLHYIVQEAIFTGDFSSMAEQLAVKAKEENIDMRIYVDASHVYLQTAKDAAQMYILVPRVLESQGVK